MRAEETSRGNLRANSAISSARLSGHSMESKSPFLRGVYHPGEYGSSPRLKFWTRRNVRKVVMSHGPIWTRAGMDEDRLVYVLDELPPSQNVPTSGRKNRSARAKPGGHRHAADGWSRASTVPSSTIDGGGWAYVKQGWQPTSMSPESESNGSNCERRGS